MTGSIYIIHLKERRAMYEAKQGTLCIIQEIRYVITCFTYKNNEVN